VCVILGLAGGEEVLEDNAEASLDIDPQALAGENVSPQPTSIGLSPNRFEPPPPGPHGGQSELTSWKYFQG
jgi:hypothetical protein